MDIKKINSPWVLFEIDGVVYAISSESVLSINQISKITPLPTAPPEIRGVINFRGQMIELVDTRGLLKRKTINQEIADFTAMIDQRFQDHVNWIETLEKSIRDNMTFTLTTDHHKCAFGKWYDSYKLKNENIMFASTFRKFDRPHQAIHQIGITAVKLVSEGKKEEAVGLIDKVRDTDLKQMLHLFEALKEAFKESLRETILVLSNETNCLGISVDQIIGIENLSEIDENFIKESVTETEYIAGVAKNKNGHVVLLLNDDFILDKYH